MTTCLVSKYMYHRLHPMILWKLGLDICIWKCILCDFNTCIVIGLFCFIPGDRFTHTCCDAEHRQAVVKTRLAMFINVLRACPACLYNILAFACEVTCSPQQSKFMWANMEAERPQNYTNGIPAVTVLVSKSYAKSLFESCKDVKMFNMIHVMDIMCGRKNCSGAAAWFQYMGRIDNGRAPMPMTFILSNTNWKATDGTILEPLNIPVTGCDQPLHNSFLISNESGYCWYFYR